jgi:hypothetical protein
VNGTHGSKCWLSEDEAVATSAVAD